MAVCLLQPLGYSTQHENMATGSAVKAGSDTKGDHTRRRFSDAPMHDVTESEEDDEEIEDDDIDNVSNYTGEDVESPRSEVLLEPAHDMTKQLLDFAEAVNNDIQKYFGRKKNDPDSCDIYEDRFTSGKSGRELYYADLLRIAQNGDSADPGTKNSQQSRKDGSDGVYKKGGTLGPLQDLFEFGLKKHIVENKLIKSSKKLKRLKLDSRLEDIVPMQKRKLPDSFFKEPYARVSDGRVSLVNSSTPDFSDLLATWTEVGGSEVSGEGESSSPEDMSVDTENSPIERLA
ncbi:LA16c-312E8.5 [Branchiostoma lanceolatum]|uniref:LA16c-312E8.5 protein n=2 Tax=Branchiostoma lanceolatum TaxID=7740 RepID=A0A8K0F3T1_BRALA|nr:LA16c-312E8.5 [Branchiostoma lanceolatum]